ncbi:MAG: Spy/CpxP family protein refolding chaperone [Thermoanaerobaculia bacterium]
MKLTIFFASTACALAAVSASGQTSPYADHAGREIKALSAEEIDGILTGRGMGLALAAELNGYPGPKHVLELATELGLGDEQHAAISKVHDAMLRDAVAVGRQILDVERRLDGLFAGGTATATNLRSALDELGRLRAALRYTHLAAHLETKALLTDAQVRRYIDLRGYSGGEHPHSSHPGHP